MSKSLPGYHKHSTSVFLPCDVMSFLCRIKKCICDYAVHDLVSQYIWHECNCLLRIVDQHSWIITFCVLLPAVSAVTLTLISPTFLSLLHMTPHNSTVPHPSLPTLYHTTLPLTTPLHHTLHRRIHRVFWRRNRRSHEGIRISLSLSPRSL